MKSIIPGLVSVVIPCYRGEAYLRETIESCLAQTYSPLEIIIVDDASPDECLTIAREFARVDPRIRIVARPQNGGIARAFNDGYAAARGEFLTRLAQDDIFEPFAIESMVEQFRNSTPGTGLVYCDSSMIDAAGKPIGKMPTPPPKDVLRYGNRLGVCVMFTRDVWETIGEFSPDYDTSEDYEYWLRVARQFRIVKREGPAALRFRKHARMASIVFAEKQMNTLFNAIKSEYGGRFRFQRGWPTRQVALAMAHLAAAQTFAELRLGRRALGHLARSFCNWPLPLPAGAMFDEPSWKRVRMLGCYLLRLARSPESRASNAKPEHSTCD